jgi:uncharacterized delta-60 repeat protein
MKNLRFLTAALAVLSGLFVTGASANTVSLDPTFNGTGYSIHEAVPPPDGSFGRSMVILPDGKILIAGETTSQQSARSFAVMRLNPDGSPDTSFGTGGKVLTTVDIVSGGGKLLLQPDGKFLLGGTTFANESSFNFTVIRYHADGSLDTSFNQTGYRVQTFTNNSWDELQDLALQPDGKIILVGRTAPLPGSPDLQWNMGVLRLNANGTLDSTFNGGGVLTVIITGALSEAHSVVVQPDGKIVLGGLYKTGSHQFLLVRLNSNGTSDPSFGSGGLTVTPVGSGGVVTSMAQQSDGKILAGGAGYVARYTPNGTLDPSFATGGIRTTGAEHGQIRVIGGDKFLIAAKFGANAGVLRFMANGAPDTNFNGGSRNILVQGNSCAAASVGVQPDGKIVLGGYCIQNGIIRFAAFRLQETRTNRFLDFDGDGSTDFSVYRPSVGQWWYQPSWNAQTSSAAQFGTSTDRPIPADYTGDGRADFAFWRPSTGEWFVLRSDNASFYSFPFGAAGDVPIAGDFDGDQIDDPGVFRPSTGEWFILKSTGGVFITTFGTTGDKAVPADFDGDFQTDIAIFRPSSGEWWIQRSTDGGVYAFQFGTGNDKPVPGDYTGDNKTDAAFWRPSTGEWFILRSEDGSYFSIPFGMTGDLPATGNYAADGRFDFVVFRPSTGTWHVQMTGGFYFTRDFGTTGDQPLPNLFVP